MPLYPEGHWVTRSDPITHTLDPDGGLVHVVYGRTFSFEAWEASMRATFADPAYRPGFGFLIDRRDAVPPEPADVRRMVAFIGRHRPQISGSRWAFVTSGPADYGMARMAQALASDHPTTLRIFETPEAAREWLLAVEADPDPAAGAALDILLVDDEEAELLHMSAQVASAGYGTYEARDAEEALRLCLRHSIRVVVTDLVMPGRDGLALITNLRSLRPDIPIVAVSGKGRSGLAIAGESGAAVVLEKPVDRARLLEAIERALGMPLRRPTTGRGAAAGTEPPGDGAP
jgi:CheY-like chemotaxis protein